MICVYLTDDELSNDRISYKNVIRCTFLDWHWPCNVIVNEGLILRTTAVKIRILVRALFNDNKIKIVPRE